MTTSTGSREPLLRVGGSTVTEHVGGEQTGGALALVEFEVEPGYPVPPTHVHEREDELTFVLEGALEVTIAGESRVVASGDSSFKPRGVPHSFTILGNEPARFLETITPAGFERYFRAIAASVRETGTVDRGLA